MIVEYAKRATLVRRLIKWKLGHLKHERDQDKEETKEVELEIPVVYRSFEARKREGKPSSEIGKIEFNPDRGHRRKFRARKDLSVSEQESIVEIVRVDRLSHEEASIRFNIKRALVDDLVSKSKKDPNFFDKPRRREEKRARKWQLVCDTATRQM